MLQIQFSVWELKKFIAEKSRLAAHQQQIIFRGHVLSNSLKFSDIGKIIKYL